MKKEMFIDIETNQSLDPKTGSIVELSYIYRVGGKIRGRGEFKGSEASIYKKFLADLDKYVDRYNKDDKMYFIGHNAQFDSNFVREMFLRHKNEFYGAYFFNPPICTMLLAAYKCMRKNVRPENFKLSGLCKAFKIKFKESELHSAAYDIELTKQLYNKLVKW